MFTLYGYEVSISSLLRSTKTKYVVDAKARQQHVAESADQDLSHCGQYDSTGREMKDVKGRKEKKRKEKKRKEK